MILKPFCGWNGRQMRQHGVITACGVRVVQLASTQGSSYIARIPRKKAKGTDAVTPISSKSCMLLGHESSANCFARETTSAAIGGKKTFS
jgi:hypothetical protein